VSTVAVVSAVEDAVVAVGAVREAMSGLDAPIAG